MKIKRLSIRGLKVSEAVMGLVDAEAKLGEAAKAYAAAPSEALMKALEKAAAVYVLRSDAATRCAERDARPRGAR